MRRPSLAVRHHDALPSGLGDWRAPGGQGWTIPVGADIGRSFKIGDQGISLQIGAYYNVKKPAGTAEWTLETQISWIH